ncbi:MAG: hypothetical protein IPK79_04440 [Vampirovibrionales bacterium]|nr:hypothetical protein [Vampirovibrionales bacterium]
MRWSPSFEQVLETQPADRLQAQLLWLLQGGEPLETASPQIKSALAALEAMTPPDCLRRLERLTRADVVRLAMLQEFGAGFSSTPAFDALARLAEQRAALKAL